MAATVRGFVIVSFRLSGALRALAITATLTALAGLALATPARADRAPRDAAGTAPTLSSTPTITPPPQSPFGLPPRSTAQTVRVPGTNFQPGAIVSIPGKGFHVVSTRYTSSTSLTAPVTTSAGVALGTYDIVVTNPDGSAAICDCFDVRRTPVPVTQDQGGYGVPAGQTTVVPIPSAFLQPGATVRTSSPDVTVTGVRYVSAGEVDATLTVAGTAAYQFASVTLINPGHGPGRSLTLDQWLTVLPAGSG